MRSLCSSERTIVCTVSYRRKFAILYHVKYQFDARKHEQFIANWCYNVLLFFAHMKATWISIWADYLNDYICFQCYLIVEWYRSVRQKTMLEIQHADVVQFRKVVDYFDFGRQGHYILCLVRMSPNEVYLTDCKIWHFLSFKF